ncbi:MAG: hypothetical protein ACJAS9_003305 [Polaribacter sp.]|jgi:hypothetical protein
MKKIYVHIGMEKTATTTIQGYCSSNRELLSARNLTYPNFKDDWIAHSCIPATIMKNSSGKVVDFYDKPIKDLSSLMMDIKDQSNGDIFISSEHFSSRLSVQNIKEFKTELDNTFPNHEIFIVSVVRESLAFFYSSYSTFIKSGGKLSIKEYSDLALKNGRYFNQLEILKDWSRIFGKEKMIIKDYDTAEYKADPVSAVLPFDLLLSNNRNNNSLKSMTIKLGGIINSSSEITINDFDKMMPETKYKLLTEIEEEELRRCMPTKSKIYAEFNMNFDGMERLEIDADIKYLSEKVAFENLISILAKYYSDNN